MLRRVCSSEVSEVRGQYYEHVSVLSLHHVVGDGEGSGRLDLLLLTPQSRGVGSEGGTWSECLWELRLVETQTGPLEKMSSETDAVVDGGGERESGDEKATVLCRWADASMFDPSQWHSVALTIGMAAPDSSSGSLVDLTVDGSGRMKVEGAGGSGANEGIAAAWLPESAPGVC